MSFFKNLKTSLLPFPHGERAGASGQSRDTLEKRDIGFMDLAASTHPSPQPSPQRGEGAKGQLPDLYALILRPPHRLPLLHIERLIKIWHIRQRPIHAPLRRCMHVGQQTRTQLLLAFL